MNLESAREPHFFKIFHGHIFAFTGTFWTKFTGKRTRSRAFFWTFSRAHLCGSRALFYGSRPLLKFTGTFFLVHGYFFTVHGHIFVICSRAKKNIHGHFFQNVHGHILKVHGKKKKTLLLITVPPSRPSVRHNSSRRPCRLASTGPRMEAER